MNGYLQTKEAADGAYDVYEKARQELHEKASIHLPVTLLESYCFEYVSSFRTLDNGHIVTRACERLIPFRTIKNLAAKSVLVAALF